jgi:hypothetical protein
MKLGLGWRLFALLISLGCIAVLLVAASINPNGRGFGTHEQLGLQACAFEARTGVPCVTCGMTTSFAFFVRGNVVASLYVQPGGTLLALLSVMAFWAGLYIAITGRPVQRLLRFVPARYYLAPLFVWIVAAWGWKIWIHVTGRDGWSG